MHRHCETQRRAVQCLKRRTGLLRCARNDAEITMTEAFICDAVRTPIGRYGGALSSVRADDLAAIPLAALNARNPQVDWAHVDDVILGCANQAGEDNRNVARMAALARRARRQRCRARPSTACADRASTRWRWRRGRSRRARPS